MGNVGKSTPEVSNQGWGLYIVSVVMVIISGLFVCMRIGVRVARRMMGYDDWMIILALLSSIFLTLTECLAVVNGYGKHMADITRQEMMEAFKWFYGAQIVYKIAVAFYKLSMLFLYLRIFPGKRFRQVTFALIGFVTTANLAFVLVTIFQCKPIAAFWDRDLLKEPANRCFSSKAFWFSYSVVNILSDFLILLLPCHEVLKLQLPLREKVALCGVFSLGIFVCATTIIRTTTLAASAESPDPTWGVIPATIWSVVEANTGTICACLPTLKKPISLLFPRLFPTSSRSTPCFFDHTPEGEIHRLNNSKDSKGNSRFTGPFFPATKASNDAIAKEVEYPWTLKSLESITKDRPGSGESTDRLTTPEAPARMGIGQAITVTPSKPGILRTTDVDVRIGHGSGSSGEDSMNGIRRARLRKDDQDGWLENGNTWPKNGKRGSLPPGFHLPRRSEEVGFPR